MDSLSEIIITLCSLHATIAKIRLSEVIILSTTDLTEF